MAFGHPSKAEKVRVEEMHDWYRADGNCRCDVCGELYYDHPRLPGYQWLRMICNGDLVKL